MPGCIVPGCTSGYNSNPEKVHFYCVPKDDDLRKKWQTAIRGSKTLNSKTHVFCEKHFLRKHIIRCQKLLSPEGKVLGVSPYGRPKLVRGAVPCIFPWTEVIPSDDESEDIPNKLEVSESTGRGNTQEDLAVSELPDRSNIVERLEVCESSEICSGTEKQESISNNLQIDNQFSGLEVFNFKTLLTSTIELPICWKRNNLTHNEQSLISFSFPICDKINESYYSFNLKEVIVDSALQLHTHVLEKPLIDSPYINVKGSITSISELEEYLHQISSLNVCRGITIPEIHEYEQSDKFCTDKRNVIRHKTCTLLCYASQCKACQNAKRTLTRKRRRHEISLQNPKLRAKKESFAFTYSQLKKYSCNKN